MTPDELQAIVDELFDQAKHLPSAARAEFLDRKCVNHPPEVRQELKSLLAAFAREEEETPLLLKEPPRLFRLSLDADLPDPLINRQLGSYVIRDHLRRGGFGDVYLAERVTDFELKVAAKVIRSDRVSQRDVLQRFEVERQVLADLRHPNIAQLLDGGATEDGIAYFVMEYIDGLPITQYCDDEKLSIPDRLRLFHSVCGAVKYAHDFGYVHRDIKPSNILVTREGVPKLLDFGIAKIVEPVAPRRSADLTEQDLFVGTPKYASPEQVRRDGKHIGPTSDVYSLGVLLYELLTGHPPYRLDGRTWAEREHVICEQDPVRPSSVVLQTLHEETPASGARAPETSAAQSDTATAEEISLRRRTRPAQLARVLRGDLETIVLKSLQKDRDRRYASPSDLAQDIDNYLEERPITARPDTALYRATKFVRRNRMLSASLVFTFAALVLAVAGTATGLVRSEIRSTETQRRLYATQLNLFGRLWQSGRFTQATARLEATRPERMNGHDFRGWEWYHLYGLSRTESLRFDEHDAPITAVAASPDGHRVASAQEGGSVLIWDTASGNVQRSLTFPETVTCLAFSPNGAQLAAGTRNARAVCLDADSGRALYTVNGHVLEVRCVAYAPDGKVLATAGADNTIQLWNARDGQAIATLQGHLASVNRVWFNRTGSRLASAGDDNKLRFWNLAAKAEETDAALSDLPSTMAVDPELKRVAFWNKSSLMEVNTADGQVTAALPGFARPLRDVAWDSQGSLLAATDEEGDTVVYDLIEKRVAAIYRGEVQSVSFLGQGQRILGVGADRRIRIWAARAPDRDHFVGHDGMIVALAAQPRGRLVATGDTLGSIRLWDITSGKSVRTLGLHVAVKGPPGTPASETLRSISATHALRQRIFFSRPESGTYTPSTLREGLVFEGHEGEIRSFSFSPDGARLASAGTDGTVRIWQVSNGKELGRLRHPKLTSSVAFAPDGIHLATACWDSVVRIWDSRKGTEQVRCVGHTDAVSAVVFDHDGRRLYSGGMDRVVRVWDAASGRQLPPLAGHTDWIHALAVSPDGTMLASASGDQTIRLWDLSTGQTRWTLVGHTQRVTSLAFHPTEPRLISASNHDEDGTVRIWDVGTGQEIVSLLTPAGNVKGLGFDSAGKQLVLTVGKQLVLWQAVDRQSLREAAPKRNEPRRIPVRLEPQAAIKVLGVMKPDQLPVLNGQAPWKPSHGAKQFCVVVATVSHDLLYPNDKQYKTLQEKAARDSTERPAGPPASYALFDPQRFTLWLGNGQKIKAALIGPLPYAREMGGFNTNVIVETSTSTFPPADRSLVAIAWDAASEPQGPLRLQIDGRDPVAVPAFELKDYRGSTNARGAAASDLLVRQSEFSEL